MSTKPINWASAMMGDGTTRVSPAASTSPRPVATRSRDAANTRKCRRCHTEKAYPEGFYRDARKPDGRSTVCRTCELSRIKSSTRTPGKPRKKKAVRTEAQIIADEEKRVKAANERAFQKLIPIEWPARKAP